MGVLFVWQQKKQLIICLFVVVLHLRYGQQSLKNSELVGLSHIQFMSYLVSGILNNVNIVVMGLCGFFLCLPVSGSFGLNGIVEFSEIKVV